MNKKSINKLVSILNCVMLVLLIINFFGQIVLETVDYKIIDNQGEILKIILIINTIVLIFINFICSIQNIKNRKMFFSYIMFAISFIPLAVNYLELLKRTYILAIIIYLIFPMIFAIIDVIKILRNKEQKKDIVPSLLYITISIAFLFINTIYLSWFLITLIMQFIQIHKQEDVVYSNKRNIINKIIYKGIYILLIIINVLALAIISIITINRYNIGKTVSKELRNYIVNLDYENSEKYNVLVKENEKWGYLNSKGEEKIQCKYDVASVFQAFYMNNKKYEIALVINNNNNLSMIDKEGKEIQLSEKFLDWNGWSRELLTYDLNTLSSILNDFVLLIEDNDSRYKIMIEEENDKDKEELIIELGKEFSYKNYYMKIEKADIDNYNVTVIKKGEIEKNREYIPIGEWNGEYEVYTYSDGYIPFCDLNNQIQGWYDNNGNRNILNGKFQIIDVKNNIVILKNYEETSNYAKILVINQNGEVIMQGKSIVNYDNKYVIEKEGEKKTLIDSSFKNYTKEYDEIKILGETGWYNGVMNDKYEQKYERGLK